MPIDKFLKTLDKPRAVIAYPQRVLHQSSTGHPVIGLDSHVQELVRKGQPLVEPLQVVRQPGLGDKVFAIAACRAYLEQNPDADLTFSGLDTDTWLKQIPWLKTGINEECNTVVNLDNTPCNGGDRAQLMGEIMGVDVTTLSFPINIPRRKHNIKQPYYVFVPFAARNGPRSLPLNTASEILKRSPIPLAFTDGQKYDFELGNNVTNCTGISMLSLISLIVDSAGVIGCDTGVPWLAAALDKPVLILGSHVPAKDRTMACQNVLWVSSPAPCAMECGDHVGTTPQCRFRDAVPLCTSFYTAEFLRFQFREFDRLVTT